MKKFLIFAESADGPAENPTRRACLTTAIPIEQMLLRAELVNAPRSGFTEHAMLALHNTHVQPCITAGQIHILLAAGVEARPARFERATFRSGGERSIP